MANLRRGDRRRGTVGHPYSALNLRLGLAVFGLVVCAVLAVLSFRADLPVLGVILAVFGFVAAVDIAVVQYRRVRRRREHPGERFSAFE
jgi:membrane protein implicated in regulation of membrane protease activity